MNRRIVIAAAKGIILAKDRSLLSDHGGPIDLTKPWAVSLMNRVGLVSRKGTKGVKSLQKDFERLKSVYLVERLRMEHNIADNLVINWDQTGSNFVSVSDWTVEQEGSKQVPIAHINDKRQTTVTVHALSLATRCPHNSYNRRKTDLCHPAFKIPTKWDIHHIESHWSTSETMRR